MFKQFIRTYRSRFGLKLYELTSAEGILLDFLTNQEYLEPALVQQPGNNWLQTERIALTYFFSLVWTKDLLCQ